MARKSALTAGDHAWVLELQCDRATNGAEITGRSMGRSTGRRLQCDRATNGAEICLNPLAWAVDGLASM